MEFLTFFGDGESPQHSLKVWTEEHYEDGAPRLVFALQDFATDVVRIAVIAHSDSKEEVLAKLQGLLDQGEGASERGGNPG